MSLKLKRQREWIAKRIRHPKGDYPTGTLAYYGPTDRVATKLVASIFVDDGEQEPFAMERWSRDDADIREDPESIGKLVEFLQSHHVKRIASSGGIMGCPHEEGVDYPEGEDCPRCPFWAGRDRFAGTVLSGASKAMTLAMLARDLETAASADERGGGVPGGASAFGDATDKQDRPIQSE